MALYSILWINPKLFIQSPIDFHPSVYSGFAVADGPVTLCSDEHSHYITPSGLWPGNSKRQLCALGQMT